MATGLVVPRRTTASTSRRAGAPPCAPGRVAPPLAASSARRTLATAGIATGRVHAFCSRAVRLAPGYEVGMRGERGARSAWGPGSARGGALEDPLLPTGEGDPAVSSMKGPPSYRPSLDRPQVAANPAAARSSDEVAGHRSIDHRANYPGIPATSDAAGVRQATQPRATTQAAWYSLAARSPPWRRRSNPECSTDTSVPSNAGLNQMSTSV